MFSYTGSCWLTPGEQEEVIAHLIDARLIKWSNKRDLPLKMGGFTDVYINLREMRNRPDTLRFLAELYENPLRRLRVDRFAEVPDAVSHLAGVIAANTNIPAVTIREEAKAGRVVKGNVIGDLSAGLRVALIDDVVTDGASKIIPLDTLSAAGVQVVGMVVLVDRQQGWRKKLADAGWGNIGIWPAMTLHDVRKFLVKKGLMQRCDKATEEKNPLVVALDGKNWEEILPIIDQLRTTGCILKVNDLLLNEGIKNLLPNLSVYGRVMADLKGHDIKNTIGNICQHLQACPPWAVTVHASGSSEMVFEAKKALNGMPTKVLAVTVLTSIKGACQEIYNRQPLEQVMKLADMVDEYADGFVCSAEELKPLREKYPNKLLVPAGIRSPGKEVHDQSRVGTPAHALVDGANHLVMGRQILEAADPIAEVSRILDELNIIL